ncbi:hypothetical protein A3Q56_04373 [Intoshia linei]|uniref:Uncharacterized protein n=1 Tax=Intoshia linei TaxID=1819745 RepID=A0A177B0W0_9BILA|nr:hypothetical protein A3Q56_04373 [Intoshia linei]
MFSHHPDKLKDDLKAKMMRNLAGEIAMDRFCTDLNKNATVAQMKLMIQSWKNINADSEKFKFRILKRFQDESLTTFLYRLKRCAKNCNFSQIDDNIRDLWM